MEQVRLYALWPMENWLGSFLNQIQGWTSPRILLSCFRARTSAKTWRTGNVLSLFPQLSFLDVSSFLAHFWLRLFISIHFRHRHWLRGMRAVLEFHAKRSYCQQWEPPHSRPMQWQCQRAPDILFLKHDSSIFRQSSNPVCGSWKSQASSPWAKQHRT